MTYSAKVLCDSAAMGTRLVTMELTYPRFVHAELMTHRVFSRNSASSRAIPINKMVEQVRTNPVMPVWWGKNQSGMQAKEELDLVEKFDAKNVWLRARDHALINVRALNHIGAHKQIVNRLLEPWMWITVIVTATEWDNFFAQRTHPDAQPEIHEIAVMAKEAFTASIPEPVGEGHYHLPLMPDLEELKHSYGGDQLVKISVARCARVSYLTHAGKRDPQKDLQLYDRLMFSGHMSPFEHVASNAPWNYKPSNFTWPWLQHRKIIPNEEGFQQNCE